MSAFTENQPQSEAIRHFLGPALVLAGPGSGKTHTIVKRIEHLIRERGVAPSGILVVTFTRAAAGEMKARFTALMGAQGNGVRFGTFHAVFYAILRESCAPMPLRLLEEKEKREAVRAALRAYERRARPPETLAAERRTPEARITEALAAEHRLPEACLPEAQTPEDALQDMLRELTRYRQDGRRMADYEPLFTDKPRLRYVWQELEAYKRRAGRLDFDDMAIQCYALLKQKAGLRACWQAAFPFLLVDEFQDISAVQYQVVRLLAGERRNLFVVGDDDQSIYGFRGARPEILRRFTEDYPDCARIALETNYRSCKPIVEAASRVIAENRDRMPKRFRAVREEGGAVRVLTFPSEQEETAFLLRELEQAAPASDTAVIFRTNRELSEFAGHLARRNVPFQMREEAKSPFAQPVAQDIRAYLALAGGGRRRADVYRILNRPERGLFRELFRETTVDFAAVRRVCMREAPELLPVLERLLLDLKRMGGLPPYGAISYLRRGCGYDAWLGTLPDAQERLRQAEALQESARGHRSVQAWEAWMAEQEACLRRAAAEGRKEKKGVQLMTLHASKGLEYDCVYLPRLNEGTLPHKKSAETAGGLEEERRLLYVGMTRARNRLCLTCVQSDRQAASRFLAPLTQKPERA